MHNFIIFTLLFYHMTEQDSLSILHVFYNKAWIGSNITNRILFPVMRSKLKDYT